VIGRGRGPDHSKEPKCERPKEHGDRQGVTMLVNSEPYELLILGCSCNPSIDLVLCQEHIQESCNEIDQRILAGQSVVSVVL
jgi:hypothetical protein